MIFNRIKSSLALALSPFKEDDPAFRLRHLIRIYGLEKFETELLALRRDCVNLIQFVSDDSAIKIGSSKIGGAPDLPRNSKWPKWRGTSLAFLCQINLSEIPPSASATLARDSGLLSFFYEAERQPWGFDPKDRGGFQVIFTENLDNLNRIELPNTLADDYKFSALSLRYEVKPNLPDWVSPFISKLGFTKEEKDRYFNLLEELSPDGPTTKLFGHPNCIQDDMNLELELVSRGIYCGDAKGYEQSNKSEIKQASEGWQLILQLDSIESIGMMWGDAGRLYFFSRPSDFAEMETEKFWMILQCG